MNNTSFRRQIAKLCIVFVLICLTVTNINPIPNAGAQEGGQPTPQPNSIPPTPTPTSASDTSEQKNELERQSLDNVMEALVPTNDDFSFATPILGDLYSDILDTTGATVASDDPYMGCGYGINSNTVWYRFTTPSAGKLRANTIGSNYDTVIAVFTGLRGSLVPIICNDDYSGLQSQIEFQVQAGQTYYLEVADYGSPGGGLLQLTVDFIHIDVPLDIVLLQDETGSMYDDIAQLQSLAPQTWDSINEVSTAGFRMSVVGFKDFARTPWGDGSDWVYRLLTDFVTDRNQFVASVNALTAYGGNDGPESQYAAANYLLASNHPCIDSNGNGNCLDFFDTPIGQQPHFRSGARRIILLATDASFHDPTNTPGYPGPSRDVVADKLLANRVIVIGLVPGGEGYVPQVDDLATLTGGSTQNTGSTGGDIANAIAIALGRFRPVSSVLSTVTVTPNTVLADGNATALVTVTLRDTANMPVAGKSVILISTRGGQDIIYQPVTQTDINGQTTGLIASLSSGDSNIIAVDVTDSVQIAQQPLIQFTPDNQELLNKINRFNSTTQIQLSNLESSVKQVGKDGDEMKRFIAEDRASIAINIFNMFWGTYKGVKEINRLRAGVQLALPGLTDAGYDVIENFVRGYPESGDLFNLTWRQAIQTENFESLTRPVLEAGRNYYAAKFLREGINELTQEGIIYAWERIAGNSNGFSDASNWLSSDIQNLRSDLTLQHTNLSNNIPMMTAEQKTDYVDDLNKRMLVPFVLNSVVWQQSQMLQNVKDAHESVGGDGLDYFILKFVADSLATASFDGVGHILVNGLTEGFDAYINSQKLDSAQRAFTQTPSSEPTAA